MPEELKDALKRYFKIEKYQKDCKTDWEKKGYQPALDQYKKIIEKYING